LCPAYGKTHKQHFLVAFPIVDRKVQFIRRRLHFYR
jgi:hypothetical protein